MEMFDMEEMAAPVAQFLIDNEFLNAEVFMGIMFTYRKIRMLYKKVWPIAETKFIWGVLPAICSLRVKQHMDVSVYARLIWNSFSNMISKEQKINFPEFAMFQEIEYRMYEIFLFHDWNFYANHSQDEITSTVMPSRFVAILQNNLASRFRITQQLQGYTPDRAVVLFRHFQWEHAFRTDVETNTGIPRLTEIIWEYRDKGFMIRDVKEIVKRLPIIEQNMQHIQDPLQREKWKCSILFESQFNSAIQTMKKQTGYKSQENT